VESCRDPFRRIVLCLIVQAQIQDRYEGCNGPRRHKEQGRSCLRNDLHSWLKEGESILGKEE